MTRHILFLGLAFMLSGAPAFADTIRTSIPAAVTAELAAEAAAQRGRGENPRLVPGLALLGVGASLFVGSFVYTTTVECGDTRSGFACGTKANKGLMFTGLAAAAAGGYLLWSGEKMRNASYVMPTPGGVAVGRRISF